MPQGLITVKVLIDALSKLDQNRAIWVDGADLGAIYETPEGDYLFLPDGLRSDYQTETKQNLNDWLNLELIVEEPQ